MNKCGTSCLMNLDEKGKRGREREREREREGEREREREREGDRVNNFHRDFAVGYCITCEMVLGEHRKQYHRVVQYEHWIHPPCQKYPQVVKLRGKKTT